MNKRETIDWNVKYALRELDEKLNYVERAKQRVKNACLAGAYAGGCILGVIGVIGGVLYGGSVIVSHLIPEKKAEAYTNDRSKSNAVEEKYSDLAKRVSKKTGVDERILLGLISGGSTLYAKDLREKGYAGIIPLRPEEAGVTARTLDSDDEQCIMSAARVFKAIADQNENKNLEAAVGTFWCREMEEEAARLQKMHEKFGWTYIDAAWTAYERMSDPNHAYSRKDVLQRHESALAEKERIAKLPEEERKFWASRSLTLLNEIKDPALIFACNAAIEAHDRYKAGEKFTWIDLLPTKLSAVVSCSLAYMNGVEFKPENGSGE